MLLNYATRCICMLYQLKIWFSQEPSSLSKPMSPLAELQSLSLSLEQGTSPLSELDNTPLAITQMMHESSMLIPMG